MASIIGDAFVWLLTNPDVLSLVVKFNVGLGLLYIVIAVWKTVEGGRAEGERF